MAGWMPGDEEGGEPGDLTNDAWDNVLVTLSSLRVVRTLATYAPFGESPRVLPRSGSSLANL